ncbi:MAG: c-type cytochrome [Chlamydiales bacterium]|nr:c-type cytochrome [Chlamydiia bacterium]MCP5508500.1 c-type cytochrome [Chlamydiales bacterium]
MWKFTIPYRWVFILAFVLGALMLIPFIGDLYLDFSPPAGQRAIASKLAKEADAFTLVDPGQAPAPIRDTVELGFHIMLDTPKYAPDYAGDQLSCTNCHFQGGNTTGGTNGSISLVGIAAVYPDYNERSKEVVSLAERIDGCFQRSMNGKPLPLNSPEMDAMLTYLHWISKDFPIYGQVPWRGLKEIRSTHTPDPANGKTIYAAKCAICHGNEGEGATRVPPLWGSGSFNDGAGMNKLETFAAFVYANMPYEDPGLTEEQALDVAAFVTQQPRPKFSK